MDVEFSEQQSLIQNSARNFLASAFDGQVVRSARSNLQGCSQKTWQDMAELGFMGINIPETYGGLCGKFIDLLVLLEEMGRVTMPGPFFSTAVYSTEILKVAGNQNVNKVILPSIAVGAVKLAVLIGDDGSNYDAAAINITASDGGNCYNLNGYSNFVPDGHNADYLLCAARIEEFESPRPENPSHNIGIFCIATDISGLECKPLETMNGLCAARITFDSVSVCRDDLIYAGPNVWNYLEKAMFTSAIAKCAEMVGACARIIEIAVEHAKERRQFGKPIGSFQAIQHHCADMLTDLDSARWMMYKTGWKIDEGIATLRDMAMTKAWCNEVCRRILRNGHQVMGGIGYCEEHDMPLFFRYIRMAEAAMGTSDECLAVVADDLLSETAA